MFLQGYTAPIGDHTLLDCSQYVAFIQGLYAKYGHGGGGHPWAWVLTHSAGGEAEGLDLFFAELTAFRQQFAS
jgi:hypothetical protein